MVKSQEQWGIAIPWYYKKHNPFYNLHNANFSIQYSFKLQQQSASCHFQGRTVVYISVSLTSKITHSLPSSAFVTVAMVMLWFLRVLFLPFISFLFFLRLLFLFLLDLWFRTRSPSIQRFLTPMIIRRLGSQYQRLLWALYLTFPFFFHTCIRARSVVMTTGWRIKVWTRLIHPWTNGPTSSFHLGQSLKCSAKF